MDSNPVCHPSPAKKMKCSFLDYVQLLMIGWAGRCTQTPFAKKINAHFWISFNFWLSAGLVNGLEPCPSPLSSQKYEMLIFGLRSISDDRPGWSMGSNPICHPSPAKNINAHFWITFNFWWSAGLDNGRKPHLPPLCSQKIKCSFLDYVQLLVISQAGQWTRTPSATPLQPKYKMLDFGLCSTSDDQPGGSMHSNPICHPSPTKKIKCSFLDYIQLLMIGLVGRWTRTPSTTSLQSKK